MTPLPVPQVPTLYHAQWWSSSRPAYILLELGIAGFDGSPVEIKDIDPKLRQEDPFLLKINPMQRLPIFHDPAKNLTLTESGAIVQHILETYDSKNKLHPAPGDLRRPDFLQLLHFGPATAYHVCVPLLFRTMECAGSRRTTDEAYEEKKSDWNRFVAPTLVASLDKYGGPFLLGEDFTAADIACAYDVMTAGGVEEGLLDKFPKLKVYHDLLNKRDLFKKLFTAPE